MRQIRRLRALIPPWQMPSDPVKAVWWFLRWFLTLLVHFFWLPILGMVAFEAWLNGSVSGPFSALWSALITLFVGLIVWGVLYFMLITVNVATGISRIISDVNEYQRSFSTYRRQDDAHSKVVEGTIVEMQEQEEDGPSR